MKPIVYRQCFKWLGERIGDLEARLKRFHIHLDLLLYCILLIAASVAAFALSLGKLGEMIEGSVTVKSPIDVQRVYLRRADYGEYLPTMTRLNPGVRFALSQDGSSVVLMVSDEELFPDLLMAMHTLQAFKPNVAWELVELCAKNCPDELVARAVVKGFTQEVYRP